MIRDLLLSRLPEALKQHDAFSAMVIRGALAALQNKEIELRGRGKELNEEEAVDALRKEVKKRKDAATLFESGHRPELAEKELREAAFLEDLLPASLGEEAVAEMVAEALAGHPGATQKDMGVIVKEVMARARGAADGALVARIVKESLSRKAGS